MGFFKQEYWSGLPFPSSRGLPNPGIKSVSPALASRLFTTKPPGKSWPPPWVWLNLLAWLRELKSNTLLSAKSLQSCPTLCDPIDGGPPGSPVPGILPARTLEWVAISFSNAWKWKVKEKSLSCVRLLATPWTMAYQAPLSMGFSRQEYWSGVPLPSLLYSLGYRFIVKQYCAYILCISC